MKYINALILLLCIATTFMFCYFESQLSFMPIAHACVFLYAALAIQLFSHESGHLIGGLLTKYKLLFLQLGFLKITMEKGKPSFAWKNKHDGQCVMYLEQADKRSYKAYNLGGVIANVFVSLLSLLLLLPNTFYCSLLCIEIVFVGLQKAIMNSVPRINNSVPNDGYIVKLLRNKQAVQQDYVMYLKLYADIYLGKTILEEDYQYERECANEEELLYYNEIQELLQQHCSGTRA